VRINIDYYGFNFQFGLLFLVVGVRDGRILSALNIFSLSPKNPSLHPFNFHKMLNMLELGVSGNQDGIVLHG
jgi:hypothetical protein